MWRGIKVKGNVPIYKIIVLLWETIKESNSNTDFYSHEYYVTLMNWKENMLNINVFLVIV